MARHTICHGVKYKDTGMLVMYPFPSKAAAERWIGEQQGMEAVELCVAPSTKQLRKQADKDRTAVANIIKRKAELRRRGA